MGHKVGQIALRFGANDLWQPDDGGERGLRRPAPTYRTTLGEIDRPHSETRAISPRRRRQDYSVIEESQRREARMTRVRHRVRLPSFSSRTGRRCWVEFRIPHERGLAWALGLPMQSPTP
jgi:hypothetical protein